MLGAGAIGVAAVATGGLALLPFAAGLAATTGGVSAAAGAAGGGMLANNAYKGSVTACLTGRGYRVVGLALDLPKTSG